MTEAASRLNREPDGTSGSVPPSFRDLAITVYREAEANGDPEWAHAMPEERAAAVAGRILTVAREMQALEARGYAGPGARARYEADWQAFNDVPSMRAALPEEGSADPAMDADAAALAELEAPDLLSTQMARLGAIALAEISTDPPAPLLCGRLDPTSHTILYGTGGVGKGTYACHLITRLVAAGHRVLILDYENHGGEWARRYHGLAGRDGMAHVLWVAPLTAAWGGRRGAIWQHAADVRELATVFGATFVVIDSIVPACGGSDPMDPGTVARYAGALEYLGIPVLSLAHVTKADDLRYAFGSVFWHNLARVTWSLHRDGARVILTHRKANSYANQGKTLVTVTWRDGLPRDVAEQTYSTVVADRIEEALGDGSFLVTAIVARLNADLEEDEQPIKPNTVRTALRRGLRSAPKRFTVDGTGEMATWRRA
jgi:AAA domain